MRSADVTAFPTKATTWLMALTKW